ncbi:MAG TPA: twin-arginine translocation signal domain-containing protein, partial [Verrucomicrobia bacterium]|nr:twin-arginine translocation signal domain-containing protein [Verrucomicrobiota bacterium]
MKKNATAAEALIQRVKKQVVFIRLKVGWYRECSGIPKAGQQKNKPNRLAKRGGLWHGWPRFNRLLLSKKMKNTFLNRRRFLQHSAAGVTAAALAKRHSLHAANKAANKLRVGVMGLGRGMAHVKNYLKLSDVEVAYV